MLCIAVCVLMKSVKYVEVSERMLNLIALKIAKGSVAAASSADPEPDSLEISPATFTLFNDTGSPGRGTSTRILSE